MNDRSAGPAPDFDDGDALDRHGRRSSVERKLMDRARRAAERDRQKGPRRPLQQALALAAAVTLVLVIALGFDAFLTSVQKVMRMLAEEESRQQQEQSTPKPGDPIPAYVVPDDAPTPASDSAPR